LLLTVALDEGSGHLRALATLQGGENTWHLFNCSQCERFFGKKKNHCWKL